MAVAFYMDVHVQAAVVSGLRRRGVDVITAREDGAHEWDDASLLQRATQLDRILFTQDDDFLAIAAQWQHEGQEFSAVVYAHQLGPGIGQVIDDLELVASCARSEELSNRVVFLPLS